MKLELSLLSIFSIVYLLLFGAVSTEISLDSIEIRVVVSSGVSLSVHPVWAIWVPQEVVYRYGANALAYGNVMVFGEHMRGDPYESYVSNHERVHIEQFRAFGLLAWPAQFALNMEPDKSITTNWNDPTQPERTMWTPPKEWWPYRWSFVTITIGGDT